MAQLELIISSDFYQFLIYLQDLTIQILAYLIQIILVCPLSQHKYIRNLYIFPSVVLSQPPTRSQSNWLVISLWNVLLVAYHIYVTVIVCVSFCNFLIYLLLTILTVIAVISACPVYYGRQICYVIIMLIHLLKAGSLIFNPTSFDIYYVCQIDLV